jgi:flagellar hook protein FlgE
MLRSLSSAVSGLIDQQTRMDVIGNNIANVNTVGFKASTVTFQNGFSQLLESATGPSGTAGGTNPMQVGLGSQIGAISTEFTQGELENTGINTDVAIQGNAFFTVQNGNESYYTRAGDFTVDADGSLVSSENGYHVQGRMATGGVVSGPITDLSIPVGAQSPAAATTSVTLSGSLDASATAFDKGSATTVDPLDPTQRALPQNADSFKDMSITVYDSLGNKQELKMVMYKTGDNSWGYAFDPSGMSIDSTGIKNVAGTNPITFNSDGSVNTAASGFASPEISFVPTDGAAPMDIKIDLGSGVNGLSQFAGASTAVMQNQDGYSSGTLQSYTIDSTGTIVGSFTNGSTQPLGQIALTDFDNPNGLQQMGGNIYTSTANSGAPITSFAGEGSSSTIASGELEDSNVDLAQEFTNMIVAQRGFQANGKVITTSDQMLQDLIGLKQ